MRGHNTDIEGNLHQLLVLRAASDQRLREWFLKNEYTFPSIVNEIIVLMGQQVLRGLLEEIRDATWFGIIADKATDVSHNEQISISIS